MFYPFK